VQAITREFESQPLFQLFDIIRDEIQDSFDASVDDPKIFEKVQWFAAYWNRSVPAFRA
jgi:hypothetical protein